MVTIWGWCLVFLIAGQQPIVQFDYKTEADCNASRILVNAEHADAASQSWCVPIPKPEKIVKAKSKKRHTARRRSPSLSRPALSRGEAQPALSAAVGSRTPSRALPEICRTDFFSTRSVAG